MNNSILSDKLFCNEYNMLLVSDFANLTNMIYEYIQYIDTRIQSLEPIGTNEYALGCWRFCKSIIEYAKAAWDNIYLGHFYTANIINRTIIENYISMKAVLSSEILWQYWRVHSCYNTPRKYADNEECENHLGHIYDRICKRYNIDQDFLNPKVIRRDYSWIYPIQKHNYSFKTLCEIVDPDVYEDYRMLCEFTHGVSFFQKDSYYSTESSYINMLSTLFVYTQYTFHTYCTCIDYCAMDMEAKIYDYFDAISLGEQE